MAGCDLDNSGTIDYNEFLAFSLNRTKLLSKENLTRTFKTFDKVFIYCINLGWKWYNFYKRNNGSI